MSNFSPSVRLGNVTVGPGHPPVLMPEIGTYFNQDIDRAEETILELREAGVRLVKGEVFLSADIVLDDDFQHTYQVRNGSRTERYRSIVERKVMPAKHWEKIWRTCADAGMPYIISAYDTETIDFIRDVGACGVKIASNNLVHYPLLRHAAKSGLAVVVDTGKASLAEVASCTDVLAEAGADRVIINHNPDGHPAPPDGHFLRIIETYRSAFACPVGLSDHYQGTEMLFVAIGSGYHLLEKPVAHDLDLEDVDLPWAVHVDQVSGLVRSVEAAGRALGVPRRERRYSDADHPARMGAVAREAMDKGARLTLESVRFAWPCRGIPARDWDRLEGRTLRRRIAAGQPVRWNDVDAENGA